MSYDQLAGQQELRRNLSASIESGRLSHAVLLTGPSGSGKTSWESYCHRFCSALIARVSNPA